MGDKMIKTKRLILRNWNIEDAESMYKYAKNPKIGPMCGWPAHDSLTISRMVVSDFVNNHPYCFAICLNDDLNNPIGCIELMSDEKYKDDELELGYWLGEEYWGNGYMTEACAGIIDFAFFDIKINKIWCGYFEGNEKSHKVQEKLGFKFYNKENVELKLLNENRICNISYINKEDWIKRKNTLNYKNNKMRCIPKADIEMMREDRYESSRYRKN